MVPRNWHHIKFRIKNVRLRINKIINNTKNCHYEFLQNKNKVIKRTFCLCEFYKVKRSNSVFYKFLFVFILNNHFH